MIFEQSWRWYGPNDSVSLTDIKQAGAHGVVTSLHHIPVGDLWTGEEIKERIREIEESNQQHAFKLAWNVVESLPVHEHIKQGKKDRDHYIRNYKESLRNLAANGVTRVCYNFMPVLDWVRTNLQYELEDGSKALRFELRDLAIFDIYILKRANSEVAYPPEIVKAAEQKHQGMKDDEVKLLQETLLLALPGDTKGFTLEKLRAGLVDYAEISSNDLRDNLIYFLEAIIPLAEELGIKMAIHPDDPPFPVFGLPRVVSTAADLEFIFKKVPQRSNGLTFCSGSLGVSEENNLEDIIHAWHDRIHFVHLRSVDRPESNIFYEANHLEGCAQMYNLVRAFFDNQVKYNLDPLPMRPDHGHQMLDDLKKEHYPGYSSIGRLRGLAELRGLEYGIVNSFGKV